jgi:Holliday junction resolvase RusA-like endonuclease
MGLTFEVVGDPVPQGSKRAFLPPGQTRPVIVDDNKGPLRTWRDTMRSAATDAMGQQPLPYFDGPVAVRLTFRLVQPKTVKRVYPAVKPDLDKLVRAALDAFTSARVWQDDAQVVQILTSKVYAQRGGLLVDIRPCH